MLMLQIQLQVKSIILRPIQLTEFLTVQMEPFLLQVPKPLA